MNVKGSGVEGRLRSILRSFLILSLGAFFCLSSLTEASDSVVLVYRGPGSCDDGDCSTEIARVARKMGLRIRYVKPEAVAKESTYEDAVLWVQPGGDGIEAALAIGTDGLSVLRRKIWNGLGYLGICAGAFMADRTVDDAETIPGLGLIPYSTYDYPAGAGGRPPQILPIQWGDSVRHLYFEGGPSFHVSPSDYKTHGIEVMASYLDGPIAVLRTHFGYGTVVLSAIHPEAPESWLTADELEDPDGSDFDLAEDLYRASLD